MSARRISREIRFNMKMAGIGSAIQQLGFLGFSFLFLEMGMNRAAQAQSNYERRLTDVARATEEVRLMNLRFGDSSASLVALQGNVADIQSLVEQATRDVGAAQRDYLIAVRDSGQGSIEAALALEALRQKQVEWGDVLAIGAPLVTGATGDIQNYEDSIIAAHDALRNLESIQKMNRIQLVMMAAFITGTAITTFIQFANAMKSAAIASATMQALTGPAGIAKVVAGLAVAGAAAATIAAFIPLEGFQHGGIVSRPTLGLLGERGPEGVFTSEQMRFLGGGAARGREEIHVHLMLDGEEIERSIVRRNRA